MNTRECPTCKDIITYKSKYRRNFAEKRELMCNKCSSALMLAGRTTTAPITVKRVWERTCSNCSVIMSYANKRNRDRANVNNSVCAKCAIRHTPESKKKVSVTLTGKKHPNRKSNSRKDRELPFSRICPNCKTVMWYVIESSIARANKQNSVCNSCSSSIYKKSWTYVIKDDHVQKMAAKKAGYDTYTEYLADLDNKKKYYREVRKVTRKQDISVLPNYDKLRGLCGVDGAYQLDHIIPVSVGYAQKIPAKDIGNITNLQIIPWKDNLLKSNNLLITD